MTASPKEATARIKINRFLESAGWRFFDDAKGPANICLEPGVNIRQQDLDAFGSDFQTSTRGFIDFLLLDGKGFPLIVLEAKSEAKHPLVGKEQARTYAKSMKCRFVILSNGNLHYFWDLERGNPEVVTAFPTPNSVVGYRRVKPDPERITREEIECDYIVLTQCPGYQHEAGWSNQSERDDFIRENKLRFLRIYQLKAAHALQKAVGEGKQRFLFEMATGTGKTLVAAAIIKLFLRSQNVRRVLFLVDRLELEDQAYKQFTLLLSADFNTVIYKESRDDWRRAEIVVTTVQSLLFNNKYQRLFSPTDFDLVISDEAHRSIGGNARAVFDYFVGYKLGLTATPRDYLKNLDDAKVAASDPRQMERRLLLDTYRTFGCQNGQPTFRYSLLDGVREGYLINPTVVDARTEITTELLSEEGFVAVFTDDNGDNVEESFGQREFEKRFFSEDTNQLLCKTFLENGLRDPISGEFGKSIVFAVSQHHAAKLTQILNTMADRIYPGRYQSDFAVQVTSQVQNAQQFTVNFVNNNLLGTENVMQDYRTSKARVCVTVGMMTTGYDCPDILNLGLFRPVFSPTDFIQIKGRGTRRHDFREQLQDEAARTGLAHPHKTTFKLFDFFANCEYFESEFDYDEVLKLPRPSAKGGGVGPPPPPQGFGYEHMGEDVLESMRVQEVGAEGMKIDRMFFQSFEDSVRRSVEIAAAVQAGEWDRVIDYINREIFDKPDQYYTLEKLRRAADVDRRLSLREILEKVFGFIPGFKSKDELLEEEFAKFVADAPPDEAADIPAIRNYFKAYIVSDSVREAIERRHFQDLATNPYFDSRDFKAVPAKYRTLVPGYVKDYVSLAQFSL